MSLIADSLKKAHQERSASAGPPTFNLLRPALSAAGKENLGLRILILIVLPGAFLTYLIYTGINGGERLFTPPAPPQVAQQPPVQPAPAPPPAKSQATPLASHPVQPEAEAKTSPPVTPSQSTEAKPDPAPLIKEQAEIVETSRSESESPLEEPGPSMVQEMAVEMEKQEVPPIPVSKNRTPPVRVEPEKPPMQWTVRDSEPEKPEPAPADETPTPPAVPASTAGPDPAAARGLFQDPDFYFNMAVFYQETGDYVEALDYYNRALQLDPANSEIYNNRSVIYKELGKYEKAVEGFMRAIHLDPKYVKAYNNIGLLYVLNDNLAGAALNFKKAIEIDPRNLESYNNLAIVYKKLKRLEDARQLYQQVLSRDPNQAEAHYNLALLYEEEHNLPQAILHYRRFTELGAASHPKLANKVQVHLQTLE